MRLPNKPDDGVASINPPRGIMNFPACPKHAQLGRQIELPFDGKGGGSKVRLLESTNSLRIKDVTNFIFFVQNVMYAEFFYRKNKIDLKMYEVQLRPDPGHCPTHISCISVPTAEPCH